jgi:tRNA(Ile)-lysidine synthetase-like protein
MEALDQQLAELESMLAEALRAWARGRGISLSRGGTRAAAEFIKRGRSGGSVRPARGMRVSRSFDCLLIEVEEEVANAEEEGSEAIELHRAGGHGRVRIGDRTFSVTWGRDRQTDAGKARISEGDRDGSVTCDRGRAGGGQLAARVALAVRPEHFPLVLRSRVAGDRISMPGGTRKLKKQFGDWKIPVAERERIPVLADRQGRIVWVAGLGIARWARPSREGTNFFVEIEDA